MCSTELNPYIPPLYVTYKRAIKLTIHCFKIWMQYQSERIRCTESWSTLDSRSLFFFFAQFVVELPALLHSSRPHEFVLIDCQLNPTTLPLSYWLRRTLFSPVPPVGRISRRHFATELRSSKIFARKSGFNSYSTALHIFGL
jgi:hypothetical protein